MAVALFERSEPLPDGSPAWARDVDFGVPEWVAKMVARPDTRYRSGVRAEIVLILPDRVSDWIERQQLWRERRERYNGIYEDEHEGYFALVEYIVKPFERKQRFEWMLGNLPRTASVLSVLRDWSLMAR